MLRIQITSRNLALLQTQVATMCSLGWKPYSNIELLFLADSHKLYIQKLLNINTPRTTDTDRKLTETTK